MLFALGVVLASILFMKRISDLGAENSSAYSYGEKAWPDEVNIPGEMRKHIYIKHLRSPLFFGFGLILQGFC